MQALHLKLISSHWSAVWVALLASTAAAQSYVTLDTNQTVPWNSGLWTGGNPPQTSSEVGLLRGGGTVQIDAQSTNTTPAGLLVGWTGSFNASMSGGSLTVGSTVGDPAGLFGLTIGESTGTATFTQSGGAVVAPVVNLGRQQNSNGSYVLAGGTLATQTILRGGSATSVGAFTFNGGTLRVSGTAPLLIGGTVTTSISAGGATIDTQAFPATVVSSVAGSGGLTKLGVGTLTLPAGSTYSGPTQVTEGVLLNGSTTATTQNLAGGSVTVAAGAKMIFARNIDEVAFTTQSISGSGDVEFQGQAAGYFTYRPAYSGTLSYTGRTIVNLTTSDTLWYQNALWLEKESVLPGQTVLQLESGKVFLRDQTSSGLAVAGLTGNAGTFLTTEQAAAAIQKVVVTVAAGQTHDYAGRIGSTGGPFSTANIAFTKAGPGTQILSGTSNNYTGGTVISGGTLQIGANTQAVLPALGGYTLSNGATLVFSMSGSNTGSGTRSIGGTGNVVFRGQSAAGGWYSTGAFAANGLTYTGTTTVDLDNANNFVFVEDTAGKTLPATTILDMLRGNIVLRQNQTIAGLAGTGGTIRNGLVPTTLTIDVADGLSYSSAAQLMDDSGAVRLALFKTGPGTQGLTAATMHSGGTTIAGGRLEIAASGQLASTGTVTINGPGAELRYNATVPLNAPLTFTQGIISGTGTIAESVTVATGRTLSPGNSPGAQSYTEGLAWAPGGTYRWEIDDALGVAATNWDVLNVSGGSLDLSALSGGAGRMSLELVTLDGSTNGPMANYVDGGTYVFSLMTYSSLSLPAGFAGDDLTELFSLDFAGWLNPEPLPGNVFVVNDAETSTISLVVVPEPTTVPLAVAAVASVAACWRRRGRRVERPSDGNGRRSRTC